MFNPLDHLSKATLVRTLDESEWLLLVCGGLLLIGIVGEYWKEGGWKKGWLLAFQIMVLLGIGGELIADAGVFFGSKEIQKIEGNDIEALGKKSQIAADKAEEAQGKADAAIQRSEDAVDEIDSAARSLASIRSQVKAQASRSSVLDDPREQARFIARVKPFAGQRVDVLTYKNPDSESLFLQGALWGHLWGAGWEIGDLHTPALGRSQGIFIMVRPDAPPRTVAAAQALIVALREAGLLPPSFPDSPPRSTSEHNAGTQYLEPSSSDTVLIAIQAHP